MIKTNEEKPKIIQEKWVCSLHSVPIPFGSRCWECLRELQNPSIIERAISGEMFQEARIRNSRPRHKVIANGKA